MSIGKGIAGLLLAVATIGTAAEAQLVDWKRVVTKSDMDRLKTWRTAFVRALGEAKSGGHAQAIAREGALLQPDAALGGGPPPAGEYRCRTIKLGAKDSGMVDYVAYPPFRCAIADEGEVMSFTKTSGSQRPVGLIFTGDAQRQIFLGTMMLGDETNPMDYGSDEVRDMAGALERIGDKRWRLILPWPHYESTMDVIELVPAT